MTVEALYVVDTNALIWHLMDDKKLGKQAREVFAAAERGETRLVVSAIVMAELYCTTPIASSSYSPTLAQSFASYRERPMCVSRPSRPSR
jgi:predicted nucleic acid-binding protein